MILIALSGSPQGKWEATSYTRSDLGQVETGTQSTKSISWMGMGVVDKESFVH